MLIYLIGTEDSDGFDPRFVIADPAVAAEAVEILNREADQWNKWVMKETPVIAQASDLAKRYMYRAFINAEGTLRSGTVAQEIYPPHQITTGAHYVESRNEATGWSVTSYPDAVEAALSLWREKNAEGV